MIDSLLMKLRRRDDVSPAEEEALRSHWKAYYQAL